MAECAIFILFDNVNQLALMENRPDFLPDGDIRTEYWVFPGGKIEPGELKSDAMNRECREETGCLPAEWREMESPGPLRSRFNQHNLPTDFDGWRVYPFLVTQWLGSPPISKPGPEGGIFKWVAPVDMDPTPDGNTCVGEITQLLLKLIGTP